MSHGEALEFHWLSDAQRHALGRALRQELTRTRDRERLLVFTRRWLYEHRLIIVRERSQRSTIAGAIRQHEAALAKRIHAAVDRDRIEQWQKALLKLRDAGVSSQSWLWAAPAKHSPRQIDELLERIEKLYELGIQKYFTDVPDDLLRRYARSLAARSPSAGRLIHEPTRTIEVAYFLRYCLLLNTDRLLLMVRRRWRWAKAIPNTRSRGQQKIPENQVIALAKWRLFRHSAPHNGDTTAILGFFDGLHPPSPSRRPRSLLSPGTSWNRKDVLVHARISRRAAD